MSNLVTVARPYAKALFEYAREKAALSPWSLVLLYLAGIVSDARMQIALKNPAISDEEKIAWITHEMTWCPDILQSPVKQFLSVLLERRRIAALPAIQSLYEAMRESEEQTMTVYCYAFAPLTQEQHQKLCLKLKNRLQRNITLQVSIDPSLLGGARLEAGDWVVDGSALAQLNQLRTSLTV